MNSPKATKDNQQNDKKLGQKKAIRDLEQDCSSLARRRQKKFAYINIVFLISHLACTPNLSKMNLGKKPKNSEKLIT